ncbi:MAG: monooxygenase family protein [Ornithinimicrobium sp.]|uniref:monooxygenase family protein n=1 Tax=Ornithinimicrobium sp. TaxID=1977084 RepID=UPI003D9AD94C
MAERLTHAYEGDLAVFLIGMTINRPWRPDLWGPVFAAMPRMLGELQTNKAAADRGEQEWWGFHQARTLMGGRGGRVGPRPAAR